MNKFYVIEIQTNADGTSGNFVWGFANRADADEKYYTVLSVACKSDVQVHGAALLTSDCKFIDSKSFVHTSE